MSNECTIDVAGLVSFCPIRLRGRGQAKMANACSLVELSDISLWIRVHMTFIFAEVIYQDNQHF